MSSDQSIALFGEINFRNQQARFGIKTDDRRRHVYIIGKTGMGKSELLKTMAIHDIQAGNGLAFVDPHGDSVEDLLDYIPEERVKDVVYVNPADLHWPIAFNVMEQVDPERRHLVADGVMNVFKKIWVDVWSPRMEYILNNTILALLETPDATLLGINRMLAEKEYRKYVVDQLKDPLVKAFWTQEFARYADRFATEATAAIQNKVGQFTSSSLIRNIIGQPKSSLDMRQIMDERKILLINISKGRVGEDASRLLGALMITKIQLAAMSRVDIHEKERQDFTLIVDEFQNFATASFASILSEARKYHLSLIIAHQYVTQMDEEVRDAVFGNVGTIITFRVGAEDAELLEKELAPEFLATDIVNLGKRQIYLKLMIDGLASKAFSARTMDTPAALPISLREKIIESSRKRYAAELAEVEKDIAKWAGNVFQGGGPADDRGEGRENFSHRPQPYSSQSERSFSPRSQNFQNDLPSGRSDQRPWSSHIVEKAKPSVSGISLSEAIKRGPNDFRGQKIEQPSERTKPSEFEKKPSTPVNNLSSLKQILEGALKKSEERREKASLDNKNQVSHDDQPKNDER